MSGKNSLILAALFVFYTNASAQITTATNGLNTPNANTVQLGGSLLQNTTIDLGNYNFHFTKGVTPLFTLLNNGNMGLGTSTPAARINFPLVHETEDPIGIAWSSWEPTVYGIHRTAGPWTGPDYQQLRLGWKTGIILDPGNSYGKSYVDIQGNGLRVTQGNVGIGTAAPGTLLSLGSSSTNSKLAIWEGEYNGQLVRTGFGIGSGQFRIFVPNTGSRFSFLAEESATSEIMTILGTGNVGIGNAAPHSKLEVGANPGEENTQFQPAVWDTYSTRFNNGNVSIFSSGNTNTAGDSYQLNFYSRYYDGGQGLITNKSAYIKGTSVTTRLSEPSPWTGRGTLVLGSTNTTYNPVGFTDVPAMYLSNGMVGIGVTAPEAQLHTNGAVRFAGLTNDNAKDRVIVSDANGNLAYRDASTLSGAGTAGWGFGGNSVAISSALGTTSNFDLPIITNNTEQMRIGANGNVGIGTTSIANYKLSVNGNIRTRKVRVDQDTWADYVFDNNFQLRSIKELEQYIQTEKHLPDVPSAAEVKKEGLDLGDNQAVLLKKIEELTLYVIEQNKKIEALQKLVLEQQKNKENKVSK